MPQTRTLLWRKVHMRLAALGMCTVQLTARLFPEWRDAGRGERAKLSVRTIHWLANPSRVTNERRSQLEAALHLPPYSLIDQVPLSVIGVLPVPEAYGAVCDLLDVPPDIASADVVYMRRDVLHMSLHFSDATPGGDPSDLDGL